MRRDMSVSGLLCLVLVCIVSLEAQANMAFSGTLIEPPPCRINDGQVIDVDFGDRIGVGKVDGENYRQVVNYRITCEPEAGAQEVSLTLNGPTTDFDSVALKTNMLDLGIRLLLGGKPFSVREPVYVDPDSLPILEAVPVQRQGVTLNKGAFEATATLQVGYQ